MSRAAWVQLVGNLSCCHNTGRVVRNLNHVLNPETVGLEEPVRTPQPLCLLAVSGGVVDDVFGVNAVVEQETSHLVGQETISALSAGGNVNGHYLVVGILVHRDLTGSFCFFGHRAIWILPRTAD